MSIFSLFGGPSAVFFVSPVAAIVTLYVVYRLARKWFDAETGLFAAAIVAWNPLFIAYAKQPMSDMTATMWTMIALALAVRISNRSALAAGLAAGAAVITRPALLIGAAMIPLAAYRGDPGQKLRRMLIAAAGLAIGVLVQMAIQQHLFGSPFSTGYGSSAALFSTSHLTTNMKIFFVRYGLDVVGPLWIPGL